MIAFKRDLRLKRNFGSCGVKFRTFLPVTGGDAGERRKSDSRELQLFFASIVESDQFLAIVKSYGNPMAGSDKFFFHSKFKKATPLI